MTSQEIGRVIKAIRNSKGITATFMAKNLGYKSVSSYLRLENGESSITLEKAKEIADIFNVSVTDFFNKNLRETRKSNAREVC